MSTQTLKTMWAKAKQKLHKIFPHNPWSQREFSPTSDFFLWLHFLKSLKYFVAFGRMPLHLFIKAQLGPTQKLNVYNPRSTPL